MKKKFLSLLFCSCLLLSGCGSFRVDADLTSEYAVALSEYTIDGYDDTYIIVSPSGKTVNTTGTFILTELGVYKVYKNGELVKEINVIYQPFEVNIDLTGNLVDETYTNNDILIPQAHLYSIYESFDSYTLNIEKNGDTIESFDEVCSDIYYSFKTSGSYQIKYVIEDMFGFKVSKSFDVTVLSRNEIFNVDFPTNWSVLNTIDFSKVVGISEGITYPVSITLIDPTDKPVEIVNKKYTFEKEGTYYATFSCDFNGTVSTKNLSFNVTLSEASYFSNGLNITSITKCSETTRKKGLEIKAEGNGSYIYYNKAINLSNYTKNDPITNFFVACDDESEMQDIRVSLIDANDESNYFSIYWKRSKSVGWEHMTYCMAEFNGYQVGICNEVAQSDYGKLREVYGVSLTCSLKNNNNNPFNFTYSKEENAVYTYRTDGSGTHLLPIIDFDDKDLLGKYEPWKGFSSDNVYLKFDFINNVKSKIAVNSIDGKLLTSSTSNVKDEDFVTFNYLGNRYVKKDQIYINSYVNHPTKLPIPNKKNILSGTVDFNLDLYLKNGASYQKINPTITDYSFVPSTSGDYKAVYSYVDIYGANQEVSLEFVCRNGNPSNLSMHFEGKEPSVLSVEEDYLTTIKVPNICVEGGVGNIYKTITYKLNGEKPISPDEYGEIYLDTKGYIEISVSASDDIDQHLNSSFYIIVNNNFQRIELTEEPKTFMAGRPVTLSPFKAFDYSLNEGQNGYELPTSVYLDGEPINGLSFVCPKNKETVTLTYYGAKGTGKEVKKDVVVKIIPANNTNNTLLDELFSGVKDTVTHELFKEGYAITTDSNLNIDYVNPLVSRDFNFSFCLVDTKIKFDSLKLILTDYQSSSGGSLILEFKNLSLDTADLWVNNVFVSSIKGNKGTYNNGSFSGLNYSSFSINLLDYLKAITLDNNDVLTLLTNNLDGRTYKGFESGLLNLKIQTTNTSSDAGIVIKGISNQTFTSYSIYQGRDGQSPAIGTLKELESSYSYQEEITTPKAVGSDVLQGKVDYITLTVTTPNGEKHCFDGTKANKLVFNQYGVYEFLYETSDYYGNETQYQVYTQVLDEEKPVIQVKEQIPGEISVGTTLNLGNYTVSDNFGVVVSKIYVYTPQTLLIEVSNSYTFKIKGKYKVIYYAADAEGNFSKVVYEILVK